MAKVKQILSADGFSKPPPKGLEHLSEAQRMELVERYKDRREREELERQSPKIDPAMRARVADLFRAFLAGFDTTPKARRRPPARRIEDISADYAANPVKLSPELAKRLGDSES